MTVALPRTSPFLSRLSVFVREWLRSPLTIGAISPSSGDLARLITGDLTLASMPVLELGGGTGVFTRAILEAGVDPHELTVFEPNSAFADLLERRFPHIAVTRSSATRLGYGDCPCPPVVGAVVSGLPILAMSRLKQVRVLVGAFRRLRPGAAFYQFTYAHCCPIPDTVLHRLGLRAELVGVAHRNLPPARVYRISRITDQHFGATLSQRNRRLTAIVQFPAFLVTTIGIWTRQRRR